MWDLQRFFLLTREVSEGRIHFRSIGEGKKRFRSGEVRLTCASDIETSARRNRRRATSVFRRNRLGTTQCITSALRNEKGRMHRLFEGLKKR